MNTIKMSLILLSVVGIISTSFLSSQEQVSGEQIIQNYMKTIGKEMKPDTEEYQRFMRGILLGEYLELTGKDSAFVTNQNELSLVLDYASDQSGYTELYGIYKELDEPEAMYNDISHLSQIPPISTLTHSRSMAVEYAYTWSISGGISRNPEYPDFGADDCTNFISQAVKVGGFMEVGSGDGCKYEDTSIEWYINPNPDPPLWCIGDFREWEWSTSWSVPWPFRDYFAYQNYYATVPGWTTSVDTAKYYLSPGDVIQLQYQDNQGNWITYHTMIVTSEDENELYMTYHSNAGGYDEVDKPLSSIPTDSTHRYLLIVVLFPEIYLPIVFNNTIEGMSQNTNYSQNPYPAPLSPQDNALLTPYPAP